MAFFCFFLVLLLAFEVGLGRFADDRFALSFDLLFVVFERRHAYLADFLAPYGFHDHIVIDVIAFMRTERVRFFAFFKLYIY